MLTVGVVTVGGRGQLLRQGQGHDTSQLTQRPAESGSGRTGPLPRDAITRRESPERVGLPHTVA